MSEQKIIDRIKALVALAESEAEQSINPNAESVAANILAKAHELARKHRIDLAKVKSSEQLASEPQFINNLGKSIVPNPFVRVNAKTNVRTIWFEELAKVIAEGFYCKLGIIPSSGEVSFYGYDSDREIAVFMLLKISELADRVCNFQMEKHKKLVGTTSFVLGKGSTIEHPKTWMGDEVFVNSFHFGYKMALSEIFKSKLNEEEPKNDEVDNYFYQNFSRSEINAREDNNWIQFDEKTVELGKLFGAKAVSEKSSSNGNSKSANSNSLVKKKSLEKKQLEASHAGDIIFLFDNSGSMNHYGKMDQSKIGIIDYATKVIETNYRIGLIRFGRFAKNVINPIDNLERFTKVVNKLELKGDIINSTYLADAIRQATARFLYRNIRRVICIVTDGVVGDSRESIAMAEMAKSIGIEIMCIGTEDADHNFLSQLASKPKLALKAQTKELEDGIKSMVSLLGE